LPIYKANLLHIFAATCVLFGGCTTKVARTSLEPYITDKQKRNVLELAAEEYCKEKRTTLESPQASVRPDYLFTTDGCTHWFDNSWTACCVAHDIAYWCGGGEEDRKEADRLLRQCANQKRPFLGDFLYASVRVWGSPWLPTPWRWGYGWKEWPRGYEKLAPADSVSEVLNKLNIPALEEDLKETDGR